jgi:hypothetical protein
MSVLFLSGMLAPLGITAQAQEVVNSQRAFRLLDGSEVRGELVEFIPGQRVVLRLSDGQVRTIAWTQLRIGENVKQADDMLLVSVRSDQPVELYEQPRDESELHVASVAAVEPRQPSVKLRLSAGGEFRVGGPGITVEEFKLPATGPLRLDISAGSRSRDIAGTTLLISGPILAAAGLFTLLATWFVALGENQSPSVGPPGWLPESEQLLISGGVLLTSGVLATVAGGISYALGKTRVRVSPARGLEF